MPVHYALKAIEGRSNEERMADGADHDRKEGTMMM